MTTAPGHSFRGLRRLACDALRACLLIAGLLLVPAGRAPAEPAALAMRAADLGADGYLVVDLPAHVEVRVSTEDGSAVVQLSPAVALARPARLPHNVVSIDIADGRATLALAPGAVAHATYRGRRLIIRVHDDPAAVAHAHQDGAKPVPRTVTARPLPSATAPGVPASAAAPKVIEPGTNGSPTNGSPTSAPSRQPQPAPPQKLEAGGPLPAPAAASAQAAPAGAAGSAPASTQPPPPAAGEIVVPATSTAGAAAFRRGEWAFVVVDEPHDALLAADPAFGATLRALPDATVVRLRVPLAHGLALVRVAGGWAARVTDGATPAAIVQPRPDGGKLLLPVHDSGRVVRLTDPDTGALLLAGTQRSGADGIPATRRSPTFLLLPSWQGVAVEAFGDGVDLAAVAEGFTLAAEGLALDAQREGSFADAASALTRILDLPALDVSALRQRMRTSVADAALAQPLARGRPRLQAAAAMLALGLGPEAAAVVDLVARDDPRLADDPQRRVLAAAAGLIAGRDDHSALLDPPGTPQTDETAFWQAVRTAMRDEGSPAAAASFVATAPLILSYPAPLRARLLPLVAETLAAGGQPDAAAALIAAVPADASLALAQAILHEARGETAAALAGYDALAAGRDMLTRVRAARRATELRLSTHQIDVATAAQLLDRQLAIWHGDARELSLRLRLAELRASAGRWRAALDVVREADAAFPGMPSIRDKAQSIVAALLAGDAAENMAPLDLVALAEENAALLPDGKQGDALAGPLADKLIALDLPARAEPVLRHLAQAASTPVARSAYGARLAEMQFGDGDADGALVTLAGTDGDGLPAALAERRLLARADATAQHGDTAQAVAMLAAAASAATDERRATILERAGDWAGARDALLSLAGRTIKPNAALAAEDRRTVLRLATAAAKLGDTALLARLHRDYAGSFTTGDDAAIFAVLTEAPVQGVADIGRARSEMRAEQAIASPARP